jgi:hypothetical protein
MKSHQGNIKNNKNNKKAANQCELLFCCNCNKDKIIDDQLYICPKCGECQYEYSENWIENIFYYRKSVHSRRRWFFNKIKKCVDHQYVNILTSDFIKIVQVVKSKRLLSGMNISRYAYYIIRLASRRGILLKNNVTDMKNSNTRSKFDNIPFGVVYPALKWDIGCKCKYYQEWLTSKN